MAATSDAAAATQKQLLTLVQTKGNAEKALHLLLQSGLADVLLAPSSDLEMATALLRIGATLERTARARSSPKPSTAKSRDPKKAREGDKQWALVAAKVAQSVIKLYIGGGADAATPPDLGDLAHALDLATLALSMSCQFESLVKLGDLVLENMLYQVAKKLGETPRFAPRALWVFAALHVRLWSQHMSTFKTLNQKSLSGEDSPFRKRTDELVARKKKTPLVLDDLVALCTFPAPQSFHTLQFTRFLISLVNAAVNMLLAAGKNQAILEVTKMLEPWITHLSRIPGVDPKLSATFSDRIFRVLWKCAAAVDAQEKVTGQDGSLEYRSLALSFMLKCPNYTNGYFIQQVYRVGLQYEKKANPASDNDKGFLLHKFYAESANALFEQRIQQGKGFKATVVEWDYVAWLEHFASICDVQPHAARSRRIVDALSILHHSIDHLPPTESANRIIAGCLLAVAGSVIVEQRYSSSHPSSASIADKEVRRILSSDVFHSTVAPKHHDTIVTATVHSDRKPHDTRWVEPMKLYLGGIQRSCSAAEEVTSTLTEVQLGLVLRLVRKISTRLFSALTTAAGTVDEAADIILSSMAASGDLLSLLRKNEEVKITGALEDSFFSLEGRIRRFSISIIAKRSVATSEEQLKTRLSVLSEQVALFQNVLDHVMSDTGKQRSSMPSLLNDLQAIAREAYTCATHFYKKQLHELVERALEAAFELAENYLEQVMCNKQSSKAPGQVEAAHVSLKLDALASLLAFSCRQQGKVTPSRKYHGHAILYSSDPAATAKTGAIDKYVHAVIDEHQDRSISPETADEATVSIVISLCESVASAWNARGVDKETVRSMIRLFGDGFQHFSTRLLDQLRLLSDSGKEGSSSQDHRAGEKINVCAKVEVGMWKLLWAREGCLSESWMVAVEGVLKAISKRKTAFCEYFVDRDSSSAVAGLWAAHQELTQALDQLSVSKDPVGMDVGGCYGWRGVFTLEICQMEGYAALGKGSDQCRENTTSTEDKALEDIRQCLACWNEAAITAFKRPVIHVFDARGIAFCLDAICHALSLMSHLQLESQARALLSAIRNSSSHEGLAATDFGIGLPSMMLQPAYLASEVLDTSQNKKRSVLTGDGSGQLHLGVIDADIGLCLASISGAELSQARVHLSSAIAGMNALRSTIKISSDDTRLYSAVAMRELALSMAESEVVFHEGNLAEAIRDAKSALSICWKISKKVGIVDPDRERYDLPDEVKAALGKHADQSQKVIAFQAIECWSWDILLAAKLILSRIAHLYVLSNQPFRSSVYYAEAMTLVSGVVPTVTRRRPFLDFAQLQVLAERTNHAMAVHELVAFSSESDADVTDQDDIVDTSVIIQNCEVQLQRGDLYLLEGDEDKSRECYEQSLRLVARIDRRTPALSCISCGCYRRLLKLQLRVAVLPWQEETVDRILDTLKKLKRELKKCTDLVEYALATCQLVQTSLALLRSSSFKAFLPVEKLALLMQDVWTRCDHLGIAHVSQEVRFIMGLIYLMRSETGGRARDEHLDVSMNWAAASLLSNYIISTVNEDSHSAENASDKPRVRYGVQSIVSSLDTRIQEALPHTWLIVSITVGELSDFAISLIPTNGHEPISFWMGKIQWAEHAQELTDLIEASRRTLFGSTGTSNGTEEWTPEKKKQWWNTRNELDDRLRILLTKIQDALGFWRALLTFTPDAQPSPSLTRLLTETALRIHQDSRALTERSVWLVSAVRAAHTLLTEIEISQCIDHVAIEENVSIQHDLSQELVKMIRMSCESSDRLSQNQARSTILVLHHCLEKFPWEGLDVLRERSVTRMPSIELILQNARQAEAKVTGGLSSDVTAYADPTNVSFLLNPAGDLKSTQNNLEPIFRRGEADHSWRGVVGEVPDEDWMRDALVKSSMFVFCGHGSGEKYFHRDKIAALRRHGCASALLFGCSSGRLEREGVFGPNGAVVSYLEAGSPAVLAMLWDVTDKDVDLMSRYILENWLLASRKASAQGELLSVVLERSRRLCKLQHLNGLAAVCYGLPLRVAGHAAHTSAEAPATKRRKLFG